MEPKHLIQLATILECGSMNKASQLLHLTQPTLTHNMQALEVRAGGKLFERGRFGVRSTALGEVLAREGRAIARRLRDAGEACARHRDGIGQTLRIGTGPLVGAALIPRLLHALASAAPRRAFAVQSDRPHVLLDQLVDGKHDLVIAPSWMDKPPVGIDRFLLVQDTIGVYCGRSHPLARTGTLQPGDSYDWVSMGSTSPFDLPVTKMLEAASVGVGRSRLMVMGDTHMALEVLAQGRHLAVLPRYPMRFLTPLYRLDELSVAVQPPARDIHLWCRSALMEDPSMVSLRDFIIEFAASLGAAVPATPA